MRVCHIELFPSQGDLEFYHHILVSRASLVSQAVKNLPAMEEIWVRSLGWEGPLEGGHGHPLQYSCLENPHGQRTLAGYSPRGHKELDTAERPSTFLSLVLLQFLGFTLRKHTNSSFFLLCKVAAWLQSTGEGDKYFHRV